MLLEIKGYKIVGIANNGLEAINMFLSFSKKPDVIIMDHRMPIKDGLEATKEILKISNYPKIIFASADETVKNIAILEGACEFLSKPFNITILFEAIERALNCQ